MNLLVTGGAGFIGSHFVRAVLADRLPGLEGASVTVLDKLAYAGSFASLGPVAENRRLDFVPADVGDAPVVGAALRGHDAVVHVAASRGGTDVTGIETLLDACLRHDVTRFLHVSTGDVYGSIDTGAWTERSPLAPATPAAAAKAGADLMALAYHRAHGLPVVVTRASDNYGPYQHPAELIPRLATTMLDGHPAELGTDGARVRDWLHVSDHCRGLALALLDGRPGEIYHIGGSVELADRDLLELIRAECGVFPAAASPADPADASPIGLGAPLTGPAAASLTDPAAASLTYPAAASLTDPAASLRGSAAVSPAASPSGPTAPHTGPVAEPAARPADPGTAPPPASSRGRVTAPAAWPADPVTAPPAGRVSAPPEPPTGRAARLTTKPAHHRQALDDDKIRRELGWRPRVEFSSGLAATVRWYRENPTWWRPLLSE